MIKNAIIIIISLIRTVGWNSNSNTGSQVNSREAKSSDSFSSVSCFTTKQTRGTRPLYKPNGFNLEKNIAFIGFNTASTPPRESIDIDESSSLFYIENFLKNILLVFMVMMKISSNKGRGKKLVFCMT